MRELRNVIEQAVLLHSGPQLDALSLNLARVPPGSLDTPASVPAMPGRHGGAEAVGGHSHEHTLAELERQALTQALARAEGNVSQAARLLGISRDTMRYRIEKHQLEATVVGHRAQD